jgi:glycosyltransferase involved in cell wall biosynthesis
MNRRILFLTIDPVQHRRRVLNEIHTARQAGLDVSVISGADARKEFDDAVFSFPVERIKLPVNSGPLRFILFNLLVFFKILFRSYELIHFRGIVVIPSVLLRQLFRKSILIYDAHEYYAGHTLFENHPLRRAFWLNMERWIIPCLNTAITVSEPLADLFKQRYSRLRRIEVIRSLPSMQIMEKPGGVNHLRNNKYSLIVFHGYFLPGRALEKMIAALAELKSLSCRLALIGEGPLQNSLQNLIVKYGLEETVIFHPMIATKELIPFIAGADLGLVLSEPDCLNSSYALPNKFFEYIMAGVPALTSDIPTLRMYVDKYDIGRAINPENARNIAEAIREMLSDPDQLKVWKTNCISAARELNWENESYRLMKMYQREL